MCSVDWLLSVFTARILKTFTAHDDSCHHAEVNLIHDLPNTGLASKIPDVKLQIVIRDLFDVKTDCRYGRDYFTDLQPVQDGRLSCAVQTED